MSLEGNFDQSKQPYRKRQESYPQWVKDIPPEMFDAEGTLTREDILDKSPAEIQELIDDAHQRMDEFDIKLVELERQADQFNAEGTERSLRQENLIRGVIKGNRQNYDALGRKLSLLDHIQGQVGKPEMVGAEPIKQEKEEVQPETINEWYARLEKEGRLNPDGSVPPEVIEKFDQAEEITQGSQEVPKKSEHVSLANKLTVSFIDISERYDNEIKDIARRRVDVETERDLEGRLPRMRKFFRRIGRNWFKDYHQRVAEEHAREDADRKGTIFLEEELGLAQQYDRQERDAIVSMFQNQRVELDEELTSNEDGERFRAILEETSEVVAVRQQIEDLVRDYVQATLYDGREEDEIMSVFMERRDVILRDVRNLQGSEGLLSEGKDFADNLLTLARTVREGWDIESSLDQLQLDIDIQIGRSRDAIKGEVAQNRFDRLMEKVRRNPVGRFLNEGTVGTITALAFDTVAAGTGMVSKSIAASVGLSAFVTAGFSANQEMRSIKQDRLRIGREMAKGYEGASENMRERFGDKEVLMHMVSAHDLGLNLHNAVYGVLNEQGDPVIPIEGQEYNQAVQAMAEISARRQFSNTQKVDLISYSDVRNIYQEKNELLVQYHETLAHLQSVADQAGLELNIANNVSERAEVIMAGFESEQTERQRNFRRLKRRSAARAAVRGGLIGATFAFGTQEVAASVSNSTDGLLERLWGGGNSESPSTILGGATETFSGWWSSGGDLSPDVGVNASFSDAGTYVDELTGNLYVNDKVVLEGLPLGENGEFTAETNRYLAENGLSLYDMDPVPVTGLPIHEDLPVREAVHLEERFSEVSGRSWLNNDTRGIYDFNELDLKWGEEDPNFFKMSIGDMTEQGSWRTLPDGTRVKVDWKQAAAEGKMYLLISASADAQDMVYPVQILPNGDINIPKDDIGKQLFSWEANQDTGELERRFLGKYAETAYLEEPPINLGDPIQNPQMLATYVGEGSLVELNIATTPNTVMVGGLGIEGVIPGAPVSAAGPDGVVPVWIPNIYDRKAVKDVSLGQYQPTAWKYRVEPTSDNSNLQVADIGQQFGEFLPAQIGETLPSKIASRAIEMPQFSRFRDNWIDQTPLLHPNTQHLATVTFDESVNEEQARVFLDNLSRQPRKDTFAINIAVTNPLLRVVIGEYMADKSKDGMQVFAVDTVVKPSFLISDPTTKEWQLANVLMLEKARQQGISPKSMQHIYDMSAADISTPDQFVNNLLTQAENSAEPLGIGEGVVREEKSANYKSLVEQMADSLDGMKPETKVSFILSVQQKTTPKDLRQALEALLVQEADMVQRGYEINFVFDTVGDPTWEEEVALIEKFNTETEIQFNIIKIGQNQREVILENHGTAAGVLDPWKKKRYAREIIAERSKRAGVKDVVIESNFPWGKIRSDDVADDFVLNHIDKIIQNR